jgi:dephospho-CoA kinase
VKTIGLTGGIGSGKSTVAGILADLGAVVISADTVGHELYQPHSAGWQRVVEAFGTDLLDTDQTINRKKLGAMVFSDPAALQRLNGILHPLIFEEIRRRIRSHRSRGVAEPIVVEAAILIEANWLSLVDEVWLVASDQELVIDRVRQQRGLSADEVQRRLDAQLADAQRRGHADVVIENTGSLDDLRQQVENLWRRTATLG